MSKRAKELLTSSYDYELDPSLIAKYPVNPPDSAKLLVYNRKDGSIIHTIFSEFLSYIPKNTNIFLNDTKVIKARVFGKKSSGGKIELLFNKMLNDTTALVMIKGRVKEGIKIYFDDGLVAKVLKLNSDGSRVIEFYKDNKVIDFVTLVDILEKIGHIPLPPYMQREDTKEDSIYYQTLFGTKEGAVAAPTASLHFTSALLERMKEQFDTHTLTLHVGAGTFKPVESENILNHPMHSEWYSIPDESAKVIDNQTSKILAIGTTVTRTIEYYARVGKVEGECDLFLHPANPPVRVNYLLTNFHLPKSTLLMLVSSFIGTDETLRVYNIAKEHRYRFFSYGDAMLIL